MVLFHKKKVSKRLVVQRVGQPLNVHLLVFRTPRRSKSEGSPAVFSTPGRSDRSAAVVSFVVEQEQDAGLALLGLLSSVWSFVEEPGQDSITVVQAGGYGMGPGSGAESESEVSEIFLRYEKSR